MFTNVEQKKKVLKITLEMFIAFENKAINMFL